MTWIKSKYSKFNSEGKEAYYQTDSTSKTVLVPVGGWDAISPLQNMPPNYAVVLDNWVPRPGYIELRGGYNVWAQGLSSSPLESLMVYRPVSGIETLFAATGTEIYNVSSYGLPTISLTGLSNARFQYVNFTPAGSSNFLYIVNGANDPRLWNGTAWSTPSIVGVTPANLIGINVHKRRVWFVENNSTDAWFLATDAIQGTATRLALGALMTKGGFLLAMATWSLDGGNGPDDLAVFISSKGQLIIYKGTDPVNANAWALVGVFDQPTPIGRRCFEKIGSDVALITVEGLLPLSQSLPFDPAATRSVAFTKRIQNAMLEAAQDGRSLFGWEVCTFRSQSLMIMNVPKVENNEQEQFVKNFLIEDGGWCKFTNWNANCFAIFNESLYFGDNNGSVNLAYTGPLDLVTPIQADAKCAFNYFDEPGRLKNMTMCRPFITADGTLTPTLSVDVDFDDVSPAAPVTILTPFGAVWDTSLWDSGLWSAGVTIVKSWQSVIALGTALAIRMKVNVAGNGVLTSQQSVFDIGVFDSAIFDGNGSITSSGVNISKLQVNAYQCIISYGGVI